MTNDVLPACSRTRLHGMIIGGIPAAIVLAATCLAIRVADGQVNGQAPGIFSNGPIPLSTTAKNGRGLADILDQAQQLYLTPITYEEVPYENSADLHSVTVIQGGNSHTRFVNPVTDFTVTLTDSASSAYLAAESVLTAYKSAGGRGIYAVLPFGDHADVVPAEVLGTGGSMRNITPVMSQRVTFGFATRSIADTLQGNVR